MDSRFRAVVRALGMFLLAFGLSAFAQNSAVPSQAAANALAEKIAAIEDAEHSGHTTGASARASEVEIESYVLYEMRDEIAVRLNSVDLSVRSGAFSATVDMVVDEDLASSHPIVGPLFEGKHLVFFDGALDAHDGLGNFTLQSVRVDGVFVPVFLVKALLESLDDPVDLDAPFDLPIGIEDVILLDRTVTAIY